FGYRAAFVLTAVLLAVAGVLVSTLVRESFVPQPRTERSMLGGMGAAFAHVLRAPGVGVVFVVRFSAWMGRTMIVPFLPLFVTGLMAGAATSGIVTGMAIGAASAAGTFTSIALGKLGDRIGHRPILIAGSFATAIVYVPIAFVDSAWQLVALYALTGATIGGVLPAISAMLAQLTDRGEAGSVYGLDNAIVATARAVSPVVGGALVAAVVVGRQPVGADYAVVFLAAAALFAITGLLAAWRIPRRPPTTASGSEAG
ncbi:MAG: MFS transporter, partial [Trueperaceae bacterium]